MKPFRKSYLGKFTRKVREKQWIWRKWAYWNVLHSRSSQEKNVLIVLGCQRSGTSLFCRLLNNDIRFSNLSSESCITGHNGSRIRLKPYAEVNQILSDFRTPVIVIKPLSVSQRANELLNSIVGSKAVWMFRHYQDVINSNVNRWSTQIANIRKIVTNAPGDWRSDSVSEKTRSVVTRYFSEDMSRQDAAALMWYARNVLFFESQLYDHDQIILCKYEDLVGHPLTTMKMIYRHMDLPYPRRNIVSEIDSKSISLGRGISIHPELDTLCAELESRLLEYYIRQTSHATTQQSVSLA